MNRLRAWISKALAGLIHVDVKVEVPTLEVPQLVQPDINVTPHFILTVPIMVNLGDLTIVIPASSSAPERKVQVTFDPIEDTLMGEAEIPTGSDGILVDPIFIRTRGRLSEGWSKPRGDS